MLFVRRAVTIIPIRTANEIHYTAGTGMSGDFLRKNVAEY